MIDSQIWRHCGSCKKPITVSTKYYACNVSTCRKASYCSMPCFNMHLPVLRHKDAWAEERTAPKEPDGEPTKVQSARLVQPATSGSALTPKEILIIASKLKDYINAKSGMNTSGNVLNRLSDMVRLACDRAIETAQRDGRKTVMDRDF